MQRTGRAQQQLPLQRSGSARTQSPRPSMSMEVFVLKALEKLRAESSRKDVDFRAVCDKAIGEGPLALMLSALGILQCLPSSFLFTSASPHSTALLPPLRPPLSYS